MYKERTSQCRLHQLVIPTPFVIGNNLYIKIPSDREGILMCLNLNDNLTEYMHPETKVQPVEIEVSVKF